MDKKVQDTMDEFINTELTCVQQLPSDFMTYTLKVLKLSSF